MGVGTVNQRGAVVGVYGLCGTDAGQYAFSSAGKSGKEMRLDKPFRDQKIRLGCQGVDSQRRAGGQNTQINGGTLLAVMDYDMFPAADFRAKFPDQLLPGSAAVASGGNENGDLRLRISAPDLGQHLRDDCLAWHRAGVVTCQQYNFMLSLCQLPQRGTADGILQGLGYQCISGSRWLFLRKTVSGNGKDPRVRDLGCNLAVSIG